MPAIAPTAEYRDVDALSPEQAADLVLRPLITHEKQLGTRLPTSAARRSTDRASLAQG